MFFCLLPALSSESSSESDSSNLTSTLDPTTKEHLLMEATAAAFLILYQYNQLEVQVNDSKVWELRCPHGCWIKSGIRSHVKLSSRGQFMALEQHYGACCNQKLKVRSAVKESRVALAVLRPPP